MKRPSRSVLLFAALCLVPFIGLFVRHQYMHSLNYAVQSFLVTLRDDNEIELSKWSTAQARQILRTQPYYYFDGTVSPRKSWEMWAGGYLRRPGPLMKSGFITTINNRNFYRMLRRRTRTDICANESRLESCPDRFAGQAGFPTIHVECFRKGIIEYSI